jgi:hypothetical protein
MLSVNSRSVTSDNSQVPGEINIASILHRQVIAEQLQRDDVQQALHTVNGLGNANGLRACGDALVTIITQDDGLAIASSNLGEGGLDFGIQRVFSHDDDHGHVLVDQREGPMLKLSSQNSWIVTDQLG